MRIGCRASDRAEGMARLRRAVGEIEARSGPAETRAPGARLSLTRALDRALGGGLAGDALHEIVPATPGDGAAAMGFALALAARFMAEHSAAGLADGRGFRGSRHGRALWAGPRRARPGARPARLRARARRAGAVPGDGGGAEERRAGGRRRRSRGACRTYDLAVSRRLLLAARAGRAPALLVQASAYGAADRTFQRRRNALRDRRRAERASALGGRRRGLPGPPAFAARLVKARLTSARGPPHRPRRGAGHPPDLEKRGQAV